MRYKACTRCQGDVYQSQDRYGVFDVCVQCGNTTDAPQEDTAATTPPLQESRQSVSAGAA